MWNALSLEERKIEQSTVYVSPSSLVSSNSDFIVIIHH
jgi:hypothetical protein